MKRRAEDRAASSEPHLQDPNDYEVGLFACQSKIGTPPPGKECLDTVLTEVCWRRILASLGIHACP
jgi:hypothetical protein